MSRFSTRGPRNADPFNQTNRVIDWLGARRPATIIVIVMGVAAILALVPPAFL